ncbi:hypothetical protein [Paraclostridium bifermentans]
MSNNLDCTTEVIDLTTHIFLRDLNRETEEVDDLVKDLLSKYCN